MPYVKICPRGHRNPETAKVCAECGGTTYLQDLPPQWVDDTAAPLDLPGAPPGEPDRPAGAPPPAPAPTPVRGAGAAESDVLVLELEGTGRSFVISSGQVFGRDPGEPEEDRVSVPDDVGVDLAFLSRWHCRFYLREGQWYVTPLNPRDYRGSALSRPNPVLLDGRHLPAERDHPVGDGDRLNIGKLDFLVRVIRGGE